MTAEDLNIMVRTNQMTPVGQPITPRLPSFEPSAGLEWRLHKEEIHGKRGMLLYFWTWDLSNPMHPGERFEVVIRPGG